MVHTMTIEQVNKLVKVEKPRNTKILNRYIGPLPTKVEFVFIKEEK